MILSPKKILLVEDDLSHKELIFRVFEDVDDMVIIWAGTLAEAKRLIVQMKPDLVLSDWRLTDGNGIDLVISAHLEFPVILMTSFGNEELAVQSMKAGVMDYLVKSPQAFENLPQNIRRTLREWNNINARQEAEIALRGSEERYRLAAEGANDIVWDYDPLSRRIYFLGRWVHLLGIKNGQNQCTWGELLHLIHPEDRGAMVRELARHLRDKQDLFSYQCRLGNVGQGNKWVFIRGKSLCDPQGRVVRFAGSLTDISVHKQNLQRIRELAFFDSITGLPNRLYFSTKLGEKLINCSKGSSGVIFFIDIDNFKIINDTFGHSVGDKCLIEITKMLEKLDIPNKFLCRLGGDEFIMIVDNIADSITGTLHAKKIMESFCLPLTIGENKFYLTASIGIASYPSDGVTVDELLKNADVAMYQSKNKGRNNYTIFDKTSNQSSLRKLTMGNFLQTAISNDELRLYYQPQIEIASGRVCGLEALIRWENSHYGFVSPIVCIKLAEELGLIVSIGYWVIRQACLFAAFLYKHYPNLYVSVNLSSMQLMQVDFVDRVKEIIHEAGMPPSMIRFEITESMLMESFESSVEKLLLLREIGVKIELDDFGTGYSSLNYLKRLPIETVKIDKTFIDDIAEENKQMDITDLIIELAHKLGLKVVAEGVEAQEQMDLLTQYKCDIIQGFLISKPLPESEVKKFLESWKT